MKKSLINKILSRYLKIYGVYSIYHRYSNNFILETSLIEIANNNNMPMLFSIYNKLSLPESSYNNCLISILCSNYYNTLFNSMLFNILIDDIISYLKANNVYEIFEYELKVIHKMTIDDYIKSSKERLSPFRFIRYAFRFKDTLYGESYWSDVDRKFINFLYTKLNS